MEVEYIRGQSGAWIPVVAGTLLHSTQEPEAEAVKLVDLEWEKISSVKSLIVLGLGGGFHIQELLNRKPFEIVVIEAEKDLGYTFRERNPELASKFDIFANYSPDVIAQELNQKGFFSKSYAVFKHHTSHGLHPFYYQAILKNLNERTISKLKALTQNHPRLLQFFESLDIADDQIVTLPTIEQALIKRGEGLESEGMIWLAMKELVV